VTPEESTQAVGITQLIREEYPITGNRKQKIKQAYNGGWHGVVSTLPQGRMNWMRLVGQEVHNRFFNEKQRMLHSSGAGRGAPVQQNTARMVAGAELIGVIDAANAFKTNVPNSVLEVYHRFIKTNLGKQVLKDLGSKQV
jgi:hypothetical protein